MEVGPETRAVVYFIEEGCVLKGEVGNIGLLCNVPFDVLTPHKDTTTRYRPI